MTATPWLLVVVLAGVVTSTAVSLGLFVAVFRRLPDGDDVRFPSYLLVLPFIWMATAGATWANCRHRGRRSAVQRPAGLRA